MQALFYDPFKKLKDGLSKEEFETSSESLSEMESSAVSPIIMSKRATSVSPIIMSNRAMSVSPIIMSNRAMSVSPIIMSKRTSHFATRLSGSNIVHDLDKDRVKIRSISKSIRFPDHYPCLFTKNESVKTKIPPNFVTLKLC